MIDLRKEYPVIKENVQNVELRFGEHGPGYIVRGPRTDVGYVVLPPGQDFPNHYHRTTEESFYTIEGNVVLWINGRERFELGPGDFFRCDPFEMHYFVNEGSTPWKALFVKAPHDPKDGKVVEWRPGNPPPDIEESEQ
jgi:quercetin dioxygenase-like cupin family protein